MLFFWQKFLATKRRATLLGGLCIALLGSFLALLCLYISIALIPPPPLWDGLSFSPMIMDRNGELMRMGLSKDDKFRQRVTLAQVPEHVQKAVLLYEDYYYYAHPGVNPFSLLRAAFSSVFGSRRIGASTLAMQVARLRYKLVTNTVQGKLAQMFRALQLVYHYGHEDVLEAYFCLAPYGGNIEGIGAAARVYFHEAVENLTHAQALALCLVPQNPQKRAFKSGEKGRLLLHANLEQARNALHQSWNTTYPHEKVSDKAPPLRVYAPQQMPFIAPHLSTEFLQATTSSQLPLEVNSTIDNFTQDLLERTLLQFVARNTRYDINNAAAMLVHWPSMEVRALAGSANFYNKSINGQVDGTRALRSPGSTLKPFIYALALDQGLIHTQTMLMDAPQSFVTYNPENFDRQFQGPLPAHLALRLSRNIPAISLASRLDPSLFTLLQKAQLPLPKNALHYGLSLVLGGAEVRMRDLVTLYAMLANGGIWQPLRFVEEDFAKIKAQHELPTPLLSPEAALATLHMIEYFPKDIGKARKELPLYYKTGTSNGFRDAWTVGIVGPYVLAVWVGNFDNTANPLLIGNRIATPLFKNLATLLTEKERLQDTLSTQHQDTKLIQVEVCRDTGDVQTELCKEKSLAWFIPGRSPIKNSGVYRKIWIDPTTNLRLCGPAPHAQEVVWEFWPSELYKLFAEADLHKPLPPAFAEPCFEGIENTLAHNTITIQSPKEHIIYHLHSSPQSNLALTATTTAHAQSLFWFVNDEYVGSTAVNSSLLWQARVGKHIVRVVDDLGQSQRINIEVQP